MMDIKKYHVGKEQIYRIIIVLAIIVTVISAIYAIINGRYYFNHRNLRLMQQSITSYGVWSPLIIFALICINTLIPPIPIPIPLIEIATGAVFGLWPGIIIIWVTQVISSIITFFLSRYIGKFFLKKLMQNQFVGFFRQFIQKKGPFAIFVIRATMSSPINISYLGGLMQVGFLGFTIATALGVIPETVLFVYLGTLMQHTRIRLWYIFIGLVVMGIAPFTALLLSRLFSRKKEVTR